MKCRQWKSKLTKKELTHLKEMGINTKHAFQNTINNQQKSREENNHNPILEPCWECRGIARKIRMKPEINI